MEKMITKTFTTILCLLLTTPTTSQTTVLATDEKCSACKAIVYELDRAMRFERPQENIKVGRQVLDSKGKRSVGQQIDYKQSELRAITIIDSLCPTMQHYGKVVKEGESRWMRVNYAEGDVVIDGSMTLGGAKSETEGKALKLYCDRVVEEHEDDWVAATQAGVDNLEARVCTQMLKLCGKEAIEALEKKKLHDEKIKKKYSKPALTIDEKRLRKKEKVVDQLISDLNRMERIKKDKMLQREKLSKDIAKYKVQVQQVKDKLKTAKDILEEEKEQQKMDL